MAHKVVTNPTSGVDADVLYTEDWNKLINHLNGTSSTDPIIFNVDHQTLKDSTTNTAGDTLRNNGTKYVRVAAREQMSNFWDILTRDNINTTYADMYIVSHDATISTQTILTAQVPEQDIDFTAKSQVKLVFNYLRLRGGSGAGTHSLRIVDAVTPTNVLIEAASITADGRQVVALTALPGWATGVQRIKVQAKADDATDDPIAHNLQVILK
jgi:hypothetical protein